MEFENHKLEWLEYDILNKYSHIIGRTFLRHGGTSQGAFSHLNVSESVGDHPDNVKVNRSLIQKSLELDHLIFAKQSHGVDLVEITDDNIADNIFSDALITSKKGVGLVIAHADCQAAIFYDSENEKIAAVHAGWKGLTQNIYKKVVDNLLEKGAKKENILVCISPSLGPSHAEFKNYREEFPKEFFPFEKEKFHFDLFEIAQMQLLAAGISEHNLEIVKTCTFANPKDYYSYRRDKITGRHATLIAIV